MRFVQKISPVFNRRVRERFKGYKQFKILLQTI